MRKVRKVERKANAAAYAKKLVFVAVSAALLLCATSINASALSVASIVTPMTLDMTTTIKTSLKTVLVIAGGAIAVMGVYHLVDGYSKDNAAAQSMGMKQAGGGVAIVILAMTLVDAIFSYTIT